jgi:o-succinylbenzoate synthase
VRITDAELYRYRLPLTAPLSVGGHSLSERHGLLLRVQGPGGTEGWGDVAPLPDFSSESLTEAQRQARSLFSVLMGTEGAEESIDDVLRGLPVKDTLPSVRFAIESAVVELCAAERESSVMEVLGGGRETVALNALIPDSAEDLKAAAEQVREEGYRAVKLKVGRRSVEADKARTRMLHASLPDDVALRLDANRGWTVEEAVTFADVLDHVSLSYVEEPLRDPTRLGDLVETTGLPIALDETTRERDPTMLRGSLPVRAIILKPTLLGGIAVSRKWARHAERQEATPVLSASYESGVGLRMLAALAASLSEAPAGLSTYAQFKTDVLQPHLPLNTADASIETLYASTVKRSAMEHVASAR